MRDGDGPPDVPIDFVVGEAGAGADEDLTPPTGFPRLRRWQRPLIALAGAGLVAAVAVNVVTGSHAAPTPQATVTVTPSSQRAAAAHPGALRVPHHVPWTQRALHVLSIPSDKNVQRGGFDYVAKVCRSVCTETLSTPHALARAVHDALPKAHRLQVATVFTSAAARSHLLARHASARFGLTHLTIDVRAARQGDVIGWNASETPALTSYTVRHHVHGRLVTVRLTAPPGSDVPTGALTRLSRDPRVLAPS